MNLLYLTMWGINDGLTASTVFPHLSILAGFDEIDHIYLYTVERTSETVSYSGPPSEKIKFFPFYSHSSFFNLLNKVSDFTLLPYRLIKFCKKNKVNAILARGAPIGSIAWMVHWILGIPYYVESFEPHADYMLETGLWKSWGLQYIFQKFWEKKQKQTAQCLITVSNNYKNKLIKEGVNADKIEVIPCCVDISKFKYSLENRQIIRNKLHIPMDGTVAIYVGKFGGVYYSKEAFEILKAAFDFWGSSLYMIILSPQSKDEILKQLNSRNVPLDRVHVDCVAHHIIPEYLSASDFAFSFVKPSRYSEYCSPIKDGEYWANGLPIMSPDKIGDDSNIIKDNPSAGVLFSLESNSTKTSFITMQKNINDNSRNGKYIALQQIASTHRNFSIAIKAYRKLLVLD